MSDWKSIETAPKDGTLVRLKRVYQGEVVTEGEGLFGQLRSDAPGRKPLGPDPLGRLTPADYHREAQETQAWADEDKWVKADRMYAFPTPTHWMPLPDPPRVQGEG